MFKRTLQIVGTAVLATGLFSAAAMAAHCPKNVKAIDEALKTSSINAAQMTQVKALRDKGAAEHSTGQHGDSINDLHEAMKILDISH
jgi:hypothetical protein